ncbi:MAG: hypothetical protein Q8S73_30555 [Deltaproteobacteria bacterium]|nr:hypothetical protein [Deltaproteobacteria bacterium]
MKHYRSLPTAVHRAEQRLEVVTAAWRRDEGTTLADIARDHKISVALVTKLQRLAREALVPKAPGPKPRPAAVAVETAAPPVVATTGLSLDGDRGGALICTLAVHNGSLRGPQSVFKALGHPPPSRDALVDFLDRAGRTATRLLLRAREQLHDRLDCLAGDDIFFHRTPIKVLIEPVSGALLNVLRWPWHTAEDWALMLEPWTALRLLVSDLGTDLVGAAALRKVHHQADFFHERAWWTEKVFEPLSCRESRRAHFAHACWDRATRPIGPGRRMSAEKVALADARRAAAEEDFFQAVRVEELAMSLFEPLSPEGQRWTDARTDDLLAEIEREAGLLPSFYAARVWRHLHRHRTRWNAHRVMWNGIEVCVRPGSDWSRERVLDAVVSLRHAARRLACAQEWPGMRAAQQEQAGLRAALGDACENLDAVCAAVASLLDQPRRSSSLVEALNSRLRVLQMVHRNVPDSRLSLMALAWNLTVRAEGRRRGPSPYARLGIDFADDRRPWYEVLLEEMNAN